MAYQRDPRGRWKWAISQVMKQVRDDILMRDQYGFGLEKYDDEISVNVRPPTAESFISNVLSINSKRLSPVPSSAHSRKDKEESPPQVRKASIFSANLFQRRKNILSARSGKNTETETSGQKATKSQRVNQLKRIYYWVFGIICFSYIISSIVLKSENTSKPVPVGNQVESKVEPVTMLSVELRTQEGSHRAWGDAYITTFDNRMGFIDDIGWTKKEADVLCRQLGFGLGALAYGRRSVFRGDMSLIVLPQVTVTGMKCTGTEMKLDECQYKLNPERSIHTGTPTSIFLARVSNTRVLGNRYAAGAICSHPEIMQNPNQLMLIGSKIHGRGHIMAINDNDYFGPICASGVSIKTVSSKVTFILDSYSFACRRKWSVHNLDMLGSTN